MKMHQRSLNKVKWDLPDVQNLPLEFTVADSVLTEFIQSHEPSAVLVELVQNEYDAEGTKMEVMFGKDFITLSGNGNSIDPAGWNRLSVMLGTGNVWSSDRTIVPKMNSIGSKNVGLRSLFVFGDNIFIRSGGKQTVLDRFTGTLPSPLPEPSSKKRPGIHIQVPYRTSNKGSLEPFDVSKEQQALDSFSNDLAPMLLKLANTGAHKNLEEVVVSSERCQRKITWKQSVEQLASQFKDTIILHRTINMRDSAKSGKKSVKRIEELEFQRSILIPKEYREQDIPEYFKRPYGRVLFAASLRLQHGKIDISKPGIFYYPLGMNRNYTGTAINISAPFKLDNDRTRIISPEMSPWNEWLLNEATGLVIQLIKSEWLERFQSDAFISLKQITNPVTSAFIDNVDSYLNNQAIWPTHKTKRGRIQFVKASELVVPESEDLDGFLSDIRYLDHRLSQDFRTRDMAIKYGTKMFTINSLVRLHCAGEEANILHTKTGLSEASYYYNDYPKALEKEKLQVKFSKSFDNNYRKLSKSNKEDLKNSPTTLAADGVLRSPSTQLWVIEPTIATVCPLLKSQRLHPALVSSKVISKLCRKFDPSQWAREISGKAKEGIASKEEQIALYKYILITHGHLSRKAQIDLRKAPVLLDHRGEWNSPRSIISRNATYAKRLIDVLHFPHRDYAKDKELARSLRFKKRVSSRDLLEYARLIETRPELAEYFEETIQLASKLLNPSAIKQLKSISFLRSSLGGMLSPLEIYLRNSINNICLGEDAPFVLGSRIKLYKQLGCREEPKAKHIVNHIANLRERNETLAKPDTVYSALVRALMKEKLPLSHYQDEPIIWNGSDYSIPADTLIGSHHRKIFLNSVPQVDKVSSELKRSLLALGAKTIPQVLHWEKLLIWLDQKYQEIDSPITAIERRSLIEAYSNLPGIPLDIVLSTRCLLDQDGFLHPISDIKSGLFVIDDDPQLARAARDQKAGVAFADTNDLRVLQFYNLAGVPGLVEICELKTSRVGNRVNPTYRVNTSRILDRVKAPEFASALETLAAYELQGYKPPIRAGSSPLRLTLANLNEISFVDNIEAIYRIVKSTIQVPRSYIVEGNRIILASHRRKHHLRGLIASAIAEMVTNVSSEQKKLTDSIYRLLECGSTRDKKEYLESRGIIWQPSEEGDVESEDIFDEDEDLQTDEDVVKNIIADSINIVSTAVNDSGDDGSSKRGQEPPTETEEQPKPTERVLPPLDNVVVTIIPQSKDWTPPVPEGRGKTRITDWMPPDPDSEEWQRKVGRRGEELVFLQEKARVKEKGLEESKVVWESKSNPGANYDIKSVGDDGQDIWIEVKSTTGRDGRFRWPKQEFELALQKRERYILWRVYEAHINKPKAKPFRDPIGILLENKMRLDISNLFAMVEPL